jgi:hypothetical protein
VRRVLVGVLVLALLAAIALWNHHADPGCADLVALFNCHPF